MRFWLVAWIPLLLILLVPLNAAESASTNRFEPEVLKFEALDRRVPPPPRPILFVGSSSIRLWTHLPTSIHGRPVLNRGFGGSRFKDLLRFFNRVVLPYGPSVVVVYEGDNDLAEGQTPAEIAQDLAVFLERAETELRGTSILLLTVKPSPSRVHLLEVQSEFNRRLKLLPQSHPRVRVIDVASPLLDSQGKPDPRFFAADRLHLNADGYEAWRQPVLDAIELSLKR
ncbi:MAG: GDSL-type esterase/lipase family protein [Verrucomicrobia bacterium]|nr:GDSL-type esterase/lipase family protein [Verrucomicrobiota bacterium]